MLTGNMDQCASFLLFRIVCCLTFTACCLLVVFVTHYGGMHYPCAWCGIGGGRWFWAWGRRKSHEWDSCSKGPLQEVYVWNYSTKLQVLWCSAALFSYMYHLSCCSLDADWGECINLSKGGSRAKRAESLLLLCKISVFVNTVVRWDLDIMLHSNLPRAPQLASPLLDTP